MADNDFTVKPEAVQKRRNSGLLDIYGIERGLGRSWGQPV